MDGGLRMKAVIWLATRLPSCEAITELVSESLERPLTARERLAKRLHFAICVWCQRFERQLHLIRREARHAGEDDAPSADPSDGIPPDASERIRQALRAADDAR